MATDRGGGPDHAGPGDEPVSENAAREIRRHEPAVVDGADDRVTEAVAYVRDLLATEEAARNPALLQDLAHTLTEAATVLMSTPWSSPRTHAAPTPAVVRRAVAFIHANAEHDISTYEIAASAGIGVRALQIAFSRHLEQTPSAYLRGVRIARAHRDLQASNPTGTATVTSIAKRWHFHHTGRFAVVYRQVYGHPPSGTLRA